MRTYDELRASAADAGRDPEEMVNRARTFAASMVEASTEEAIEQAAYRIQGEREKESECSQKASIRTYEELRGIALEMGYCPEEAVKRARTFAACMTESSTGEAVRLVAQKMRKGLPVSMDNRPGRDLLVGGEGV